MPLDPRQQNCAAQHFGPWMVEPKWFAQAVSAVKGGTFAPATAQKSAGTSEKSQDESAEYEFDSDGYRHLLYHIEAGGVARIPMFGQMTKGDSSFGGVNSVRARRAVRKAVADDRVNAILLHIDSPGGTCAGTGDLAMDVAKADTIKPCYTYFEDLGASAAYWVGCQSRRVFANPTAEVGSIGTMTYVEDTSKAYEMAGIKVTLIATGKFKGQWIDGHPVSDEYIESVRTEVEDLNEHFLAGVMSGRKISRDQLMAAADGRVFIAAKAKTLGLIDEVASIDAAMTAIQQEIPMNGESFTKFAAENPDDAAVKALTDKIRLDATRVGVAQGVSEERSRVTKALELTNAPQIAKDAVAKGLDADTIQIMTDAVARDTKAAAESQKTLTEQLAAKDAEIAKLSEKLKHDPAVGTAGAARAEADKNASDDKNKAIDPDDHEAVAKAEWSKMSAADKKNWFDEATFVNVRKGELKGNVSVLKPAGN